MRLVARGAALQAGGFVYNLSTGKSIGRIYGRNSLVVKKETSSAQFERSPRQDYG